LRKILVPKTVAIVTNTKAPTALFMILKSKND